MPVSKEQLEEIALSRKEYNLIVKLLGREPTEVELGLFGSLWSEHCGYKHSKALLKMFPSMGKHVLVKPGEENAGVIDIGDGQVIGFKMESHNHPSYIEPYQGAATGVGGIVRDIFTMGIAAHRPDEFPALRPALRAAQPLPDGRCGGRHRRLRQLPGHRRCGRRDLFRRLLQRQPAGQRPLPGHRQGGLHGQSLLPTARATWSCW